MNISKLSTPFLQNVLAKTREGKFPTMFWRIPEMEAELKKRERKNAPRTKFVPKFRNAKNEEK